MATKSKLCHSSRVDPIDSLVELRHYEPFHLIFIGNNRVPGLEAIQYDYE